MDDLGPRRDGVPAGELSGSADEVTCQQFVELVTDYFEGTLTSRTLRRVEEHLVICEWCVTYLEQMEATIRFLGELSDPPASEPSEALVFLLSVKRDGGG